MRTITSVPNLLMIAVGVGTAVGACMRHVPGRQLVREKLFPGPHVAAEYRVGRWGLWCGGKTRH
jgi:hypothetical protein